MSGEIGPDFLCVGMPKAGTTWLFDQLSHHPDFWMPPIKELHYFDGEFPKDKYVEIIRQSREEPAYFARKRKRMRARELESRDQLFFDDVLACRGKDIDFELYARLFRHKDGLLTGDMTPRYCSLEDELIARIAQAFPKLKIVLLLRDPVSRAWSRIIMRYRKREFSPKKLEDLEMFKKFMKNGDASLVGKQTEIFARWKLHFPESQVRYFFMDDIAENPAEQRGRIMSFLGADPSKKSGDVEPGHNPKSRLKRVDMPDRTRDFLIEYFEDETRASVEVFGPRAGDWLKRYGLSETRQVEKAGESRAPD